MHYSVYCSILTTSSLCFQQPTCLKLTPEVVKICQIVTNTGDAKDQSTGEKYDLSGKLP